MKKNNIFSKIFLWTFMSVIAVASTSCDDDYQEGKMEEAKLINDVKINAPSNFKLAIGMNFQSVYSIIPEDATDQLLVWKSSKEAVATVTQDGYIETKSLGETYINIIPSTTFDAVNYSMSLQTVEANDNPNVFAVTYGPLVLAGAMGTEGMVVPAPFSNPQLHNDYYTYDYHVPANLKTGLKLDKNRLGDYIKPSAEYPLVFHVGNENIRMEPIHKIHRQRYVVYWNLIK